MKSLSYSILAAMLIAVASWAFKEAYEGRQWTMQRITDVAEHPATPPNIKSVVIYRTGRTIDTGRTDMDRLFDYIWQRHLHLRSYGEAMTVERQQREREMIDHLSDRIHEVLVQGGLDPDETNLSHHSVEQCMVVGGRGCDETWW